MFEAIFQSFEDRADRRASAARVAALRIELERRGLDGFIVPRADRYQNEYVPPYEERLAWLTGFTGSAGLAIVLADRAVLFVDGRYQVQVREEVDGAIFSIEHLLERPPPAWIEANLPAGTRLGYSPWLHTVDNAEWLTKACAAARASLVPVEDNPIDAIWIDRPKPPLGAIVAHVLRYAGEDAGSKLSRIRAEMQKLAADVLMVSDPQAVSWLFNIRGSDVPHTPVALAFAMIPKEGRPALFVDLRKLNSDMRQQLEEIAEVRPSAAFERDLVTLGQEHRAVRLDPSICPEAVARLIVEYGGEVVRGPDPLAPMKAVKNPVEITGARAAHQRDGVAVTRFLASLTATAAAMPKPLRLLSTVRPLAVAVAFTLLLPLIKSVPAPTLPVLSICAEDWLRSTLTATAAATAGTPPGSSAAGTLTVPLTQLRDGSWANVSRLATSVLASVVPAGAPRAPA